MTFSCSFCAAGLGETDLLFVSQIGGLPPAICGECVSDFAAVMRLHEADPALCACAIAAHNAHLDRAK